MTDPLIRHLAALGSSFAAGPGIPPVVDRGARRSGRNYAHLVAERLGAGLTDLTVSGATTRTVVDTRQRVLWRTFPPQLPQVPSGVDLVTVTAGGNDLRYLGSMVLLGHADLLSRHRLTRPLGVRMARGGVPRVSAVDVDRASQGLVDIVTGVRARAPGARVLLVDYLTILGPQTPYSRQAPFDATTRDAIRALGAAVVDAFAVAARRSGAELVAMGERSGAHVVGSAEPWVQGFTPGSAGAFHPNAAGMSAVAEAIVEHLGGGAPSGAAEART